MKRLLVCFLFFSQITFAADSESGYLYRDVVNNQKVSLFYDAKRDMYSFKVRGKTYTYDRFRYKRMLDRHIFDIPEADMRKLKDVVGKYANTQKMSKATDEEILTAGLDMLKSQRRLFLQIMILVILMFQLLGHRRLYFQNLKSKRLVMMI